MKMIPGIVCLLITILIFNCPAWAQNRPKENFEKRATPRKSISGWFSFSKKPAGKKGQMADNVSRRSSSLSSAELSAYFNRHKKSQRLEAEKIWLRQQKFREQQRTKKREPTAWEIAYLQQEKTRLKELKKLLKERDKRIAARAKSRSKAMASAARYRKKKARLEASRNKPRNPAYIRAYGSP